MKSLIEIINNIVIISFFYTSLLAQGPDTLWTKRYNYGLIDWANCVTETNDSGYFLVGYTLSGWGGESSIYLIKTDKWGNPLWTKTYGEPVVDEEAFCGKETSDGHYVVTGRWHNGFLMKLNPNGDTVWVKQQVVGGTGYSVIACEDGYIITGGGPNLYITKIDPNGNILWIKIYDHDSANYNSNDIGKCINQSDDGGYIILGETHSFSPTYNKDFWLLKTNANGDTIWTRIYGTSGDEYAGSVIQTVGGGYIAVGYTNSGPGGVDIYLIKIDESGNLIWVKTFGTPGADVAYSVDKTIDNNYILIGETDYGAGEWDIYLIKVNENGDTLWTRKYGTSYDEEGWNGKRTSDGGYIITGCYGSMGGFWSDVYLVKTKPDVTNISEEERGISNLHRLKITNMPRIVFYNSIGQKIVLLSGTHELQKGHQFKRKINLAPGVYFIKLKRYGENKIKKLLIIK